MVFEDTVYSVLIVSSSQKSVDFLRDILPQGKFYPIEVAASAGEARRKMLEYGYDLIFINAPLTDEFGSDLAEEACDSTATGVMMFVGGEHFDEISGRLGVQGVLTVAKPTTRQTAYQTVLLLCATRERLRRLERKNATLTEKMNEIRAVNRAKWYLIEKKNMSEGEAHRFIEKTAMDNRISKLKAASDIIEEGKNE